MLRSKGSIWFSYIPNNECRTYSKPSPYIKQLRLNTATLSCLVSDWSHNFLTMNHTCFFEKHVWMSQKFVGRFIFWYYCSHLQHHSVFWGVILTKYCYHVRHAGHQQDQRWTDTGTQRHGGFAEWCHQMSEPSRSSADVWVMFLLKRNLDDDQKSDTKWTLKPSQTSTSWVFFEVISTLHINWFSLGFGLLGGLRLCQSVQPLELAPFLNSKEPVFFEWKFG